MRLGGTAADREHRGHIKATSRALLSKERGSLKGSRGDRVEGWSLRGISGKREELQPKRVSIFTLDL